MISKWAFFLTNCDDDDDDDDNEEEQKEKKLRRTVGKAGDEDIGETEHHKRIHMHVAT